MPEPWNYRPYTSRNFDVYKPTDKFQKEIKHVIKKYCFFVFNINKSNFL